MLPACRHLDSDRVESHFLGTAPQHDAFALEGSGSYWQGCYWQGCASDRGAGDSRSASITFPIFQYQGPIQSGVSA